METQENKRNERENGFTLIELLIAIVVVGILAAVAIVGIGGLTNTGSKASCTQSLDSAKVASAAFYANQTPNVWPTSFSQLTTDSPTAPVNHPVVLELGNGVAVGSANTLTGSGWTLTATFTTTASPDFTSTGNGCTTP